MAYYKINGGYYEGSPGNITAVTNRSVLAKLMSGELSSKKGKQDLFYDSSAGENESSASSGGSGRSSSNPGKYKYSFGGRSYENKSDARDAARDGDSKSNRGRDDDDDDESTKDWDDSQFRNSSEFKSLDSEDQEAVLAVFGAIAGNDATQAKRLTDAFKATSKINDPYFAQKLRLATDAIERGYVSIDKEAEFAEQQLKTRLADFREDYENKKEFLSLEEATALRGIERSYTQELDTMQQGLAQSGFTNSSRRAKKEGLLDEATGDLRESTNRSFAFQQSQQDSALDRNERDTAKEVSRLNELTSEGKLDFLRNAEKEVGSANLPDLAGAPDPLGDIQGSIAEEKLQNTISSASAFVF